MNDSPLAPGSRVVIAGASGLIGSALTRSLAADGHEVVRLVRREPRGRDEVRWDPEGRGIGAGALAGCAAVVNLAGAGIASRRWTESYKRTIRESRVRGTTVLAEAVASLDERPSVFVNGSAIGFYGDTGDRAVDESAGPGEGFLPSVCVAWEEATAPAREAGVRTVLARTGLVVGPGVRNPLTAGGAVCPPMRPCTPDARLPRAAHTPTLDPNSGIPRARWGHDVPTGRATSRRGMC
ncbi:NAD-dependent epimerase/dehydratase family protein [Streptomyces sp. me109]|nr:NAD-dependent epimerase/dehydratase family protein [Streptomyces sp. me109]